MKGLIKKDLLNLASYKTSLFILIIFCSIAIISTNSVTFAPIIISTIIGMIVLSTFNYDEISKSDKYILSLPVTRKDIVLSKYILAIASTIISAVLGVVLTVIIVELMNMIRSNEFINLNYDRLFSTALGGMFGIALIQSIQIPSIYKWGAEKGRIQMFVLIFLVILLVLGSSSLFAKIVFRMDISSMLSFLNKFGIFLLVGLIMLMYYISYKISYKIFSKKDFYKSFLLVR